jgi:hypothetical protein
MSLARRLLERRAEITTKVLAATLRFVAFSGLAGVLTLNFFIDPWFNELPQARFSSVLDGIAARPYAGRVLVPWLAHLLARVVSPTNATWFQSTRCGSDLLHNAVRQAIPRDHMDELVLVVVVGFVSLYVSMEFFSRLMRSLRETSTAENLFLTLLSFLSLPLLFIQGNHFFYDLPTVCGATVLLYCIATKRNVAFAIVFIACTLNKETSLVYVIMAAALRYAETRSWRKVLPRLGAYVGLYLAIRLAVLAGHGLLGPTSDRDNFFRNYMVENFRNFAVSPIFRNYVAWFPILFCGVLVFRRLGDRPMLLKVGLAATLAFVFAYVRGGMWGEVRVFYEVFPVLALLSVTSLSELVKGQSSDVESPPRPWEQGALWCGTCIIAVLAWGAVAAAFTSA